MIVRIFRGVVRPGKEEAFAYFVRNVSTPALREHAGVVAVHHGRRHVGDRDEFVVVSVWRDWEALQEFAGDGIDAPLFRQDVEALSEASSVEHYEVM